MASGRLFRPARRATVAANVAKTLAQTLVFWVVFLGVVPLALSAIEREAGWTPFRFPSQGWSPWLLLALMSVGGLTSGIFMAWRGRGTPLPIEAPRELVVAGPYRHVRNPMAIFGLLQGAAVGLLIGSPLTLVYCLAGGIVWDRFVRPIEEADLAERFGSAFEHYRSEVDCWRPRLRPYRPEASTGSGGA